MQIECRDNENGRRGFFTLFVNGDPWRDISKKIFGNDPRGIDSILSVKDWQSTFFDYELKRIKAYLLRLLAGRDYSTFELRGKLRDLGCGRENIEKALREIKDRGYIDDKEWVDRYIDRSLEKKVGPKIIALKLIGRGVPRAFVEESLKRCAVKEKIVGVLESLIAVRYRDRDPGDRKQRYKIMAALYRRGFEAQDIERVFSGEII